MKRFLIIVFSVSLLLGLSCTLWATTYQVGPSKTYTTLQNLLNAHTLYAGDVVQVDGNVTYPAGVYIDSSNCVNGTVSNPITIIGIKVSGNRPKISGTSSYGLSIEADGIVLQGLEINGGGGTLTRGIGVFGTNITVRDCVIHDCKHGLIGYGTGTGNVTVEYTEFYGNGLTSQMYHQIYMATDEIAHPGATFRLQYCYVHNCVYGCNVKTRSERNEIYYNWIELAGSSGQGLGLFAPDVEDNPSVTVNTAREDSDVVGNVIIQSNQACARLGGDTPGYPTNGRYRFVNNTFIHTGSADVIRTFNVIETLEMYNNVVYNTVSGSSSRVLNDDDGAWVHSPRSVIGSNNWVISGATSMPSEWTNTLNGTSSPFVDVASKDYRPAAGSPLINAGASSTPTFSSYPFPNPLFPPAYHPPQHTLLAVGTAEARPVNGTIDIGAFEVASSDTTSPAVGMTAPSSGATVSGTITVSATASDNIAISKVQFFVDGSTQIGSDDTSSPYSISYNTTSLSDGDHTLTAKAYDTSNNTTTTLGVIVTVSNNSDITPPVVAMTAPSSGSTVTGTITVSATASDNVGVVGVQFLLDGSNLGSEDTASPYSISMDTSTLSNGTYSILARARDAANNTTTSVVITIVKSIDANNLNIIWRNYSTGQNVQWMMNGTTYMDYAWLPQIADTHWGIKGNGDLNADGKSDLVWRNGSTGQNVVWFMDGATYLDYAWLPQIVDSNWDIVGVADFNADNKVDVLWRNGSTGQNVVWFMNGVTYIDYSWIAQIADTNWKIVGIGDFNGDSKTDILWRNQGSGADAGKNVVWFMNGSSYVDYAWLPQIADTNWQIVGSSDFNQDSGVDLLWRNYSTGENLVWFMNGATYVDYAWLPQIADVNWKIAAVGRVQ